MKKLLFTLSLLFTWGVQSQVVTSVGFDTTQRKLAVDLSVNGELASSSISNRFIFPLIFGGKIERSVLVKEAERQGELPRLGYYIDPEIAVSLFDVRPFKEKNWGLKFQAGMLMTGAGRIPGDLIGMAMIGNESYLGQTIKMASSAMEMFNAHKIGFGLVDAKTKSSVTLNAYGIQSYMKGALADGQMLFGNTGGFYLSMDGRFDQAQSNAYYVGAGVGVDASFNLNVGKKDQEMYFNFSIKNLGVGFLNNPLNRYVVDSAWNYNGFSYEDLSTLKERFENMEETLEELGINKLEGPKAFLLPMQIHIGKLINESLTKRWQFSYGLRIYVQNAAIPFVYGNVHWRANNWLRVGAGLHYGGYGGLRGNVYLQGIWEKFVAGLHFNNAMGLTPVGKGISANLTLGYRINK